MGLDICLIKPCELEKSEGTTRNPKVVRNFPQYVIDEEEEEYDYDALGHPEFNDEEYWDNHGWYHTDEYFYVTDDPYSGSGIGYTEEEVNDFLKDHTILEKIKISDIPIKTVIHKAVPYLEVGYQRKGANQKFYEDGKWEDPEKCVVTYDELLHDILEYFSGETPDSPGGWGSFTEYQGISDEERRKTFMENIGSKFIEGETAVMYW